MITRDQAEALAAMYRIDAVRRGRRALLIKIAVLALGALGGLAVALMIPLALRVL